MTATATQAVAQVLALSRNLTPDQELEYLSDVVAALVVHLRNAVKVAQS